MLKGDFFMQKNAIKTYKNRVKNAEKLYKKHTKNTIKIYKIQLI